MEFATEMEMLETAMGMEIKTGMETVEITTGEAEIQTPTGEMQTTNGEMQTTTLEMQTTTGEMEINKRLK